MKTKMEIALVSILLLSTISCKKENPNSISPTSNPSSLTIAGKAGKVLVLNVNASAAAGGNGSSTAPFQTIEDALAAAREAVAATKGNLAVTIAVAPGTYSLSTTLNLDIPGLLLRGSNVIQVDTDGWPTGAVAPGTETKLLALPALANQPIILINSTSRVTVTKFTIDAGSNAMYGIRLIQAQGFMVSGNVISGNAFLGINTIASTGTVDGNYITGVGGGTVIWAGNAASPANVKFVNNRSVANAFGGVLVNGAVATATGYFDEVTAVIDHNDLSFNTKTKEFSFGIRIIMIYIAFPAALSESKGHVTAMISHNRITQNEMGLSIDAGFPYRTVGNSCDDRTFSGTFDITLIKNMIAANHLTPALITFTRSTAAFNPKELEPTRNGVSWQYLHGAVYTIRDPANEIAGYWFDHPANDPVLSSCVNDQTKEQLNNTLIINGTTIANGRNLP